MTPTFQTSDRYPGWLIMRTGPDEWLMAHATTKTLVRVRELVGGFGAWVVLGKVERRVWTHGGNPVGKACEEALL